jgi:gas vesicle protein
MKTSGLLLGFGLGLIIGVAAGWYMASSEEDKTALKDDIQSKMDKAKKAIGKLVNEGMKEFDKASETV